jgi:hypothetical protein
MLIHVVGFFFLSFFPDRIISDMPVAVGWKMSIDAQIFFTSASYFFYFVPSFIIQLSPYMYI